MDVSTWVNIILSILSFVLAAVSVITVIITLRQNKRLLDDNEKQLSEMRKEHQLSVQPVIAIEDIQFHIERPRFFYTPPSDEYSFHARYDIQLKLHNISDAAAVCIDAFACISIPHAGEKYQACTIVHREKVLSAHSESPLISLSINSDNNAILFEGLRGIVADELPQIMVSLTYKNAVGGCFAVSEAYLIVAQKDDDEIIRKWHTQIKSAPVETKEILATMQRIPHDEKWENAFQRLKQAFDEELGFSQHSEIVAKCIDLDEKYRFGSITEKEYKRIAQHYSYSHFIHKQGTCKENQTSNI